MSEPKLRFKSDDGNKFPEWKNSKIGDVLKICHGRDYKEVENASGSYPVLGTGGIITYSDSYLCDWKCALIGRKGTIDKPQYMETPFWCVDTLFFSKPKDGQCAKFQYYLFQTIDWQTHNEASGVPSLSASNIENIDTHIPCFAEQQKIAVCLSAIDNVIEKTQSEIEAWEKHKRGVMQMLFSRKVRFKADDGSEFPEWEEKTLNEVLTIDTRKNNGHFGKEDILSVSEHRGVVNQIELQGRSFAGENIDKYNIVQKGQIVYTRSPLRDKPYGIIKLVGDVNGIVSPLYIVNNVTRGNDALFVYYYFDTPERTNNYLRPLVRMGAKHTMNISNSEWLSGKVCVPSFLEQQKIAACLSAFDDVIDKTKKELDAYRELKKGLLQQMFV